jgi:flagellar basal-body rod protein FlgB
VTDHRRQTPRTAGIAEVPVSELSLGVISASLDGLAARQRVIASNIANAETPGYLAQRVSFEDSLRNAISQRDMSAFEGPTTTQSLEATLPNGNNVQLDEETVSLTETNLKYQLMTTAASNEFHVIHASIG